jgi:serine/threonine protein kinase
MIIQNEYCDGGSLQDYLTAKGPLTESQLLILLAHVADGLRYAVFGLFRDRLI